MTVPRADRKYVGATTRNALVVLAFAGLTACSTPRKLPEPVSIPSQPEAPQPTGNVKIGQPYQINNIWYYPKDDANYDQTGIASWYGHPFHGQPTANGETYDMDDLTAAHQTLPLPSWVRVTNLDNGRSIVLKINDRGPFVNGRIIDLSRRAARLLGFYDQGTAKVRVQRVNTPGAGLFVAEKVVTPDDERKVAAAPLPKVTGGALPPPKDAKTASAKPIEQMPKPAGNLPPLVPPTRTDPNNPEVSLLSVPKSTAIYIQIGAFSNLDNAKRLTDQLKEFGGAKIAKTEVKGQTFHRVRFGPIPNVDAADDLLNRVLPQYPNARIIVD
jgi:rare lipoprotein A